MLQYGEGKGNPLQYSCRENPMDRGAWWATVHGVTKSQTLLSDSTSCFRVYISKYKKKPLFQKDTGTPKFIAALFTLTKI